MSIEAVGAIAPAALAGLQESTLKPAAPSGFGNWFTGEVAHVNQQLLRTQTEVQALASGQATSLHEVMMHMEEAKLSFELLSQIRNRLLESYQEVMRTQV